MIRRFILSIAAASAIGAAPASAEMYKDYSPEPGIWEINAVDVDPNHIDDYLVGLRRTQTPGFEIMKKRGMIDAYKFVIRNGYSKGNPSVLIMVHYVNMAALTPDKARDQAIDKEIVATLSKTDGEAAVAGYEKYRTFVDDAYWTEVTLAK